MPLAADIQDTVPDEFRLAMRRLAATVTIITCSHEGARAGMAATAVTSLCMAPPSILVCVNNSASIHPLLMASRTFCVNVLNDRQHDIARLFGGKVPQAERFVAAGWRHEGDGLPYLDDAQAAIFCDLADELHYGTHSVFIGRVTAVRIAGEIAPLVYADGKFSSLTM